MSAVQEMLEFARSQAREIRRRRYDDPLPDLDAAERELAGLLSPEEAARVLDWFGRLVDGGMDPEEESLALASRLEDVAP